MYFCFDRPSKVHNYYYYAQCAIVKCMFHIRVMVMTVMHSHAIWKNM